MTFTALGAVSSAPDPELTPKDGVGIMDGTLMVTKCRECGQPLHAHLCMQTIMVICCNPRCALFNFDLDAATYDTLDLSNYKRRRYEQAS